MIQRCPKTILIVAGVRNAGSAVWQELTGRSEKHTVWGVTGRTGGNRAVLQQFNRVRTDMLYRVWQLDNNHSSAAAEQFNRVRTEILYRVWQSDNNHSSAAAQQFNTVRTGFLYRV